jgi:hypothetical protein
MLNPIVWEKVFGMHSGERKFSLQILSREFYSAALTDSPDLLERNIKANMTCRICENSENNRLHRAREMMFGLRDEFDYLECARCGTLQIADVPDLSRYYPQDYYSLSATAETGLPRKLKSRLAARLAADYFLNGRNLLGRYLARKKIG